MDWGKEKKDYWDMNSILKNADDDFWHFVMSVIRSTSNSYPRILMDKEEQKNSYTWKEYSEVSIHAAILLKAFMIATDCIKGSAKEERSRLAIIAAEASWRTNPERAKKLDAKKEAQHLWSTASRSGWSSAKMHHALISKGYSVEFTTVQKWMACLRKGQRLVPACID